MLLRFLTSRLEPRSSQVPPASGHRSARNARWVGLGIVVAVAGVAAVASAQPAAAPLAKAPATSQVGFEHLVELSPAQQEAEATAIISQMQATASTVQRMLAQARQARDVVKTLCLNDKVSQVDVGTRSATDRKASLHSAASRNDRELSNHEFTILTVLKHRVEQLSAEANQCIGDHDSRQCDARKRSDGHVGRHAAAGDDSAGHEPPPERFGWAIAESLGQHCSDVSTCARVEGREMSAGAVGHS